MDDTARHPGFTRSLSRGQLIALDGLAAVGLLAAVPSFPGASAAVPAVPVAGWVEAGLLAAGTLPVAVRRLWPRTVFGVVAAATVLAMLLGVAADPFIAASFALYLVAVSARAGRRRPPLAVGVGSIGLLSVLAGTGVALPRPPADDIGLVPAAGIVMLGVAVMGGTWTVGRAVADRRVYQARAAAQLAERAVARERLRIARELHDVVAHSMSLIAVKAGIANHVASQRPAEARDALRVIETASRGALAEMRQLLGVLRAEADPATALDVSMGVSTDVSVGGPDVRAELGPAPGPDGLAALADRAALAGVRVEVDARGLDGLPEGVGLSVYRIVQEALTNVVKHAAPAGCRVTVAADGRQVVLEVTDDGPGVRVLPGQPGGGGGHGLIGMRERVAVYGGTFSAGPGRGGGFRVSARLPYTPAPSGPRGAPAAAPPSAAAETETETETAQPGSSGGGLRG